MHQGGNRYEFKSGQTPSNPPVFPLLSLNMQYAGKYIRLSTLNMRKLNHVFIFGLLAAK